ncbi:MAG TPA: heavy metal-binding domain-containing protein [Planctomycetaceae bacterium]|nr:heavy metal-binding domain-containing protein [Planctomycetaceae bacterium]
MKAPAPPTTRDGIDRLTARTLGRALQVRLRFVAVLLIAVAIVSGWPWLRNAWDILRYTWNGKPSHQHAISEDTEYFCPMDPGVLSAWPSICPICNMDLVRRKKGEATLLPEGVVSRMQFSPYRVQLAGIRTSRVEALPLVHHVQLRGRLQGVDGRCAVDAIVLPSDGSLFADSRPVQIRIPGDESGHVAGAARRVNADPVAPTVRITFDQVADWPEGTLVEARADIPACELDGPTMEPMTGNSMLAVPATAVIDRDDQRYVFVESMPGMFDGTIVTLGRRCGDSYPVLAGLQQGQLVATAGVFLIDAETRLNPSVASSYFGANQSSSAPAAPAQPTSTPAPPPAASKTKSKTSLSPADQALVKKQRICPVTMLPLDSMGGPVPVKVGDRTVFICCKGCEGKLKQDPDKYLAKLPQK